jgi:F-type H+-transporting ATPase subunit b
MLDISLGTVVWSSIAFLAVAFILAKFAWKPILASIKEREDSIDQSLKAAEKARLEMSELKADNEELLKEARLERDALLKDARTTKDRIIQEAKEKANDEYSRILNAAKEAIHNEKMAAIVEVKNQVATLSLEIAEKLIREKFSSPEEQKKLIDTYIAEADTKLN